jgi:hypothetical protein
MVNAPNIDWTNFLDYRNLTASPVVLGFVNDAEKKFSEAVTRGEHW